MRKLYLYILPVLLIISSSYYSQTATVPLSNSYGVVDNVNGNKMFYSQSTQAGCCGNDDGSNDRVIVTYEALNLTITSTILSQLQHSTYTYTDDNNSGPSLLQWNGGISVGDVVNVYMIYLNDNTNRRGNYGEFTFQDDIVAVGMDWRQTLWFSGTRFSTSDYPKYSAASSKGKFRDRKFEPYDYNNGSFLSAWDNQNSSYDWFQVLDANGSVRSPNYNGTAIKKFRLGCNNGAKGDFFRIITKQSCPTSSASASPTSICSGESTTLSAVIVSGATYQWRVSGNSSVLSNNSTYNVSPASTTTYELTVSKDGCSRTDDVTIAVSTNPTDAGSIGNPQTNCNTFDPQPITSISDPVGGTNLDLLCGSILTNSSATGPWTTICLFQELEQRQLLSIHRIANLLTGLDDW